MRSDGGIPRAASGAGIKVSGPLGSSPWGLQEDGHILFAGVSQAKEGSPGVLSPTGGLSQPSLRGQLSGAPSGRAYRKTRGPATG